MSRHDFAPSEFERRHARVRAAMKREGIDLLIVIHPVNINYLIGTRHKAYQEFQCLFFTLEKAPPVMLTRLSEVWEVTNESLCKDVRGWGGREPQDPIDVFKRIVREKGFGKRRIGLEVPRYYISVEEYLAIKDFLGTALKKNATLLIEELKFVKSPAELAYIRKAVTIADAAVDTFVKTAKPGRTELQIAGEMHRTLMSLGSDTPASPMNFVSGPRTAYAHGMPTERKLKRGDYIQVEYGAAYKRYCTTLGRQAVMGKPTPRMREIYQVVRDSCDACIDKIRAGVPAIEPHKAAKAVIAKAGMDRYRLHTTGYGIAPGFPPLWGETIQMFPGSPYTLEAGMVLSIEPPVFIAEEGLGCRIIDNVLVTERGCDILSKSTRDLIEL